MPNIGPMELVIVLVIALLVLGPKRLPQAGRSLGQGMREFKDSISGDSKDEGEDRPALSSPPDPPAPTPDADSTPTSSGTPEDPAGRASAEVGSEHRS